ncbi:MAG TPA: LppX_LprAFG lipoprotein [Phototrophicaceae bacterium]|nr:LppX_LprAFG lipoprotein [Phototrophicaceae bacterium]
MLRTLCLLVILLLVGCSVGGANQPTPTPPDPVQLITTAAANIRSAKTFRITVSENGPDYMIYTDYATVFFRSANAQYVSPGMMEATVRVVSMGALTIPIDVSIFSRGKNQYYRAIWTGGHWVNQAFAPNFDPESLIAENTGFQAAMKALINLSYVGQTQLETGENVYQLSATANGPDVAALLGDLIEPVGTVEVGVYIDTNTLFPARFTITEHDSPFAVTPTPGKTAQPVVWTIDLFDINGASQIETPEAVASTAEATTGATAEASAPANATAPAGNLLVPITPEATATLEATPEATSAS